MKRITNHPVLGKEEEKEDIVIMVNGKKVVAKAGDTIAAALMLNGFKVFRFTEKRKSPRALFCGIGQCTDCSMTVNGVPNVRTCITRVEEGMVIETQDGRGNKIERK